MFKKKNEQDNEENEDNDNKVIMVPGNYCDNYDVEINNNNNNISDVYNNESSDDDIDFGTDALCLNLIFNEIECTIGNRLFRMLIEDKDKVIGKKSIGRGFTEIKK